MFWRPAADYSTLCKAVAIFHFTQFYALLRVKDETVTEEFVWRRASSLTE